MRARVVLAVTATVLVAAAALPSAEGRGSGATRVTVFGDSAATAMSYNPEAKRILARGIDLRLEVAACRRVADSSCPYDGARPPNVVELATQLGQELGPVVVVIAGYNDYESHYADNIELAMDVFRKAGVERVLWATLHAIRPSYETMNEAIVAAARRHPSMTILDWNALAGGHEDWFASDGIHLTAEGANRMAAMVNDGLVRLGVAPKPVAPTAARPLAIASRALPVARHGRSYAARLKAVGGAVPYRWTRVAGIVAPGLRLTTRGRLEGIPARAGTFTLTARVVDRAGASRTRAFVLRIF